VLFPGRIARLNLSNKFAFPNDLLITIAMNGKNVSLDLERNQLMSNPIVVMNSDGQLIKNPSQVGTHQFQMLTIYTLFTNMYVIWNVQDDIVLVFWHSN